jgi:hypothetical protein
MAGFLLRTEEDRRLGGQEPVWYHGEEENSARPEIEPRSFLFIHHLTFLTWQFP